MAMQTISIELPEEIIALLGGPEAAAEALKQAIVMDLLRKSKISEEKAAEVLGITTADVLDLMEHGILHRL